MASRDRSDAIMPRLGTSRPRCRRPEPAR